MAPVWQLLFRIAVVSSLPLIHAHPGLVATTSQPAGELDHHNTWWGLSVPISACASDGADDVLLDLDLRVGPTSSDLSTTDIELDGQRLDIFYDDHNRTFSTGLVRVVDDQLNSHTINVTWFGGRGTLVDEQEPGNDEPFQLIKLDFWAVCPETTETATPTPAKDLSHPEHTLFLRPGQLPALFDDWWDMAHPSLLDWRPFEDEPLPVTETFADPVMAAASAGDGFDLAGELESLRLLEAQAARLNSEIQSKKGIISSYLRDQREKYHLSQLIEECDGMICAAKVIFQRICDKMGLETSPSFNYAQMKDPQLPNMVALYTHGSASNSSSVTVTAEKHDLPLKMAATSTTEKALPVRPLSIATVHQHPFMKAFSILASILGLTALVLFIRRRCMSIRRRVEHAADREERRNARAYRRAARRALMRKRWDAFRQAVSCFRAEPEPRLDDYEEKRALILQDAFMEQALDTAEKGEVMEAEIRELRHAQEIVSSLVRADEYHRHIIGPAPVHDPPPPLVPLPFTPTARSRASSSTLPSYFSESLPGYTSRPNSLYHHGTASSIPSSIPSCSASDAGNSSNSSGSRRASVATSPPTDPSVQTRCTPTSSVRDFSTRPSEETLRTRQSRDA